MKKLLSSLSIHIIFIILIQLLYVSIYLTKPQLLTSYWLFFYSGFCLFVYLTAGWMAYYSKMAYALASLAGFWIFLLGLFIQSIGIFFLAPMLNSSYSVSLTFILKFFRYQIYYGLIAIALSLVGAHLCRQYVRRNMLDNSKS